jgi:ribonuclease HII
MTESSTFAPKSRSKRVTAPPLQPYYRVDENRWEIGIDEAGRGPLFGRLYVAGVILPKDDSFDHSQMKDSKKFHSETKIRQVAEYIRTHAIAWHVAHIEPAVIDEINIRQAVLRGMRECARRLIATVQPDDPAHEIQLLVDGNDFETMSILDRSGEKWIEIPHITVEGGDNTYSSIAAASILAKVSRDDYIAELCKEHPDLIEQYAIDRNKGYGTKAHMEGIREHGVTEWHRRSYAPCR